MEMLPSYMTMREQVLAKFSCHVPLSQQLHFTDGSTKNQRKKPIYLRSLVAGQLPSQDALQYSSSLPFLTLSSFSNPHRIRVRQSPDENF